MSSSLSYKNAEYKSALNSVGRRRGGREQDLQQHAPVHHSYTVRWCKQNGRVADTGVSIAQEDLSLMWQELSNYEFFADMQTTFFTAESDRTNLFRTFMSRAYLMTASQGTVIVRQGDIGDSFYVLLSGKAHVVIETEEELAASRNAWKDWIHSPNVLDVYSAGQSFGELSLLSDEPKPRSATIVAVTQTVMFRVDKQDYLHLIKLKHESFLNGILSFLRRNPLFQLRQLLSPLQRFRRSFVEDACLVKEEWAYLFTTHKFVKEVRSYVPINGNEVHFITRGEAYLYRKDIGLIARLLPGDLFGHERGLPAGMFFNTDTMLVVSTETVQTLSISRDDFISKIVEPNGDVLYERLRAYTCAREAVMTQPAQRSVDHVDVLMQAFPCIVNKKKTMAMGLSTTGMNQLYQALAIDLLTPGMMLEMKDIKDKFGVVLSGSVSLYAESDVGVHSTSGGGNKESLIGDMVPGDHVGELELLHDTNTSTRLVANTHVYMGYIDKEVFLDIFDVEDVTESLVGGESSKKNNLEVLSVTWPFKFVHLYRFMKHIEAFSTIKDAALMQLTRSVEVMTVGIDTVIIPQGVPPPGVYFILEGECAVLKEIKRQRASGPDEQQTQRQSKTARAVNRRKDPKPIVLNILSAGQHFGERCLFTSQADDCSYVSVSKRARLLYIKAKQFEHLLTRKTLSRFRSIHQQRVKWRKERGERMLAKFQSVLHVVEKTKSSVQHDKKHAAETDAMANAEGAGGLKVARASPLTPDNSLQDTLRKIIFDEARLPQVGKSSAQKNVDVVHHPQQLDHAGGAEDGKTGGKRTKSGAGEKRHRRASSMIKAAVKGHFMATRRPSLYAIVNRARGYEGEGNEAVAESVGDIAKAATSAEELLEFVRVRKNNRKMRLLLPTLTFIRNIDMAHNLTDGFTAVQRWSFVLECIMRQLRVTRRWQAVARVKASQLTNSGEVDTGAPGSSSSTPMRTRHVRRQSLLQGTRLVTSPEIALKSGIKLGSAAPNTTLARRVRGKRNALLFVSTLRTSVGGTTTSEIGGTGGHIMVKPKSRLSALRETRDGFDNEQKASATFLTAINEENNRHLLASTADRDERARKLMQMTEEEKALTEKLLEEAAMTEQSHKCLKDLHPMEDLRVVRHAAEATVTAYPHGQHLKDPLNAMTAMSHSLDSSVLLSAAGVRSAVFSRFQAKERRSFQSDTPRVNERAEQVARRQRQREWRNERKRMTEMLATQWANISKAEDEQEFSHESDATTVKNIRKTIVQVQRLIHRMDEQANSAESFERVRWQHNNSELALDAGGEDSADDLLLFMPKKPQEEGEDAAADGSESVPRTGGKQVTPWVVKNMHGDDIDIGAALRADEEGVGYERDDVDPSQRKRENGELVSKMSIVLWITGLNVKRTKDFDQLKVQSLFHPTLNVVRLYTSPMCEWVFVQFVPDRKHPLHRVVARIHERLSDLGQEHWAALKITQDYMKHKLFQGMIAERSSVDDLQDQLNNTDLQRKVRCMLRREGKLKQHEHQQHQQDGKRTSAMGKHVALSDVISPLPRKPMAPSAASQVLFRQTKSTRSTFGKIASKEPWTSPFLAQRTPRSRQSSRSARLRSSAGTTNGRALSARPTPRSSNNNRDSDEKRLVVTTLELTKLAGAPAPMNSHGAAGRRPLTSRGGRMVRKVKEFRKPDTPAKRTVIWAGNRFQG